MEVLWGGTKEVEWGEGLWIRREGWEIKVTRECQAVGDLEATWDLVETLVTKVGTLVTRVVVLAARALVVAAMVTRVQVVVAMATRARGVMVANRKATMLIRVRVVAMVAIIKHLAAMLIKAHKVVAMLAKVTRVVPSVGIKEAVRQVVTLLVRATRTATNQGAMVVTRAGTPTKRLASKVEALVLTKHQAAMVGQVRVLLASPPRGTMARVKAVNKHSHNKVAPMLPLRPQQPPKAPPTLAKIRATKVGSNRDTTTTDALQRPRLSVCGLGIQPCVH